MNPRVLDLHTVSGDRDLAEESDLFVEAASRPDVRFRNQAVQGEASAVVGHGRARRLVGMNDRLAVEPHRDGHRVEGDERLGLDEQQGHL